MEPLEDAAGVLAIAGDGGEMYSTFLRTYTEYLSPLTLRRGHVGAR